MRIYLASSWRNEYHPEVLAALKVAGHEVYDYRNDGFTMDWPAEGANYEEMHTILMDAKSVQHFEADYDALDWAECVVMLMPSGRSAHLELGYGVGKSKITVILWSERDEPDLMHLMCDLIANEVDTVIDFLGQFTSISRDAWQRKQTLTK